LIDKIIFYDIPRIYPVDEPPKIRALIEIFIENPGMVVDFQSLSQELGSSRQTLSKYCEYLEAAHLITKCYNFSRNRVTSEKKLKKFYPTVLTPALSYSLDETYYGKIMEAVIIEASKTRFFWRDNYKNEVDVVCVKGKELIPVEVKYRNEPRASSGLEKFCEKYGCKQGVVVTKNTRKKSIEGKAVVRMAPAYEYLLEKN
jgi:predicted AAA+ superfamily ATPase